MALNIQSPETLSSLSDGREILEAARLESSRLLAEAKMQVEQIFAQAREAGLSAGKEAASALLAQAASAKQNALSGLQTELLEVISSICSEVVGSELKTNPSSITARIERAISTLNEKLSIRLSIHPEALSLVEAKLQALPGTVTLVSDPSLGVNEARLESSGISVHASPERHLAALLSALRDS